MWTEHPCMTVAPRIRISTRGWPKRFLSPCGFSSAWVLPSESALLPAEIWLLAVDPERVRSSKKADSIQSRLPEFSFSNASHPETTDHKSVLDWSCLLCPQCRVPGSIAGWHVPKCQGTEQAISLTYQGRKEITPKANCTCNNCDWKVYGWSRGFETILV